VIEYSATTRPFQHRASNWEGYPEGSHEFSVRLDRRTEKLQHQRAQRRFDCQTGPTIFATRVQEEIT
jgi:hypothetical protein